jgi:hypothetical protein
VLLVRLPVPEYPPSKAPTKMTVKAEPKTRVCYDCGLELPLDHFRRRKQGAEARQGRCRLCYNAYMRQYRRHRRVKALHRFASRVKSEPSPSRVAALCDGMIVRFGGLEALCAEWAEVANAVVRENRGSRAALNVFQAMFRLVEVSNAQPPEPDVVAMSNDQLERHLLECAEAVIRRHPGVALAAAERIGWTVIPPGEDQRADPPFQSGKHL